MASRIPSLSSRVLRICHGPTVFPQNIQRIPRTGIAGLSRWRSRDESSRWLARHAPFRSYGTEPAAPTVEGVMQKIEELYDAANEEFQIASEETTDNTIYAAEDRAAARAEFERLKAALGAALEGPGSLPPQGAEEVRRRASTRVRELESALLALEERARSQG